MADNELPAVAKSVYVDCKKCGAERYHTVIAHTGESAAKLKCEVCGASKTQKFGAAAKIKAAKAARKPRATKASDHRAEYDKLIEGSNGEQNVTRYDMKLSFQAHQKLQHPKFGIGVIRASHPDKIEVVFEDEVRNLVHNRT